MKRTKNLSRILLMSLGNFALIHGTAFATPLSISGSTAWVGSQTYSDCSFGCIDGHHVSANIKDTASNALCAGINVVTAIANTTDPSIYKWNCSGNGTITPHNFDTHGWSGHAYYQGNKIRAVNGNGTSAVGTPGPYGNCSIGNSCYFN